jgi:hypothetical protein
MKNIAILLMVFVAGSVLATPQHASLDSNTAFYDGELYRYVIPAPNNFKLVIEEAFADGYSMAFIPKPERYDSASIIIGINIYKTGGASFDSLVMQDTATIRHHFGSGVKIEEVLPFPIFNGDLTRTFYLKREHGYVPNAILSYFDGENEMIIFELVITENVILGKAEQLFEECLRSFKPLKRGTLGKR